MHPSGAYPTKPKEIYMHAIEILKKDARENEALNAMCHVFAVRKRSRSTIKIPSLMQKMRKEGFNYDRDSYEKALVSLDKAKVGELVLNKNKRISGLKNIRHTLQSLGQAVCEDKSLDVKIQKQDKVHQLPVSYVAPVEESKSTEEIGLLLHIDGKTITLDLPRGLSGRDIGTIIDRLRSA